VIEAMGDWIRKNADGAVAEELSGKQAKKR